MGRNNGGGGRRATTRRGAFASSALPATASLLAESQVFEGRIGGALPYKSYRFKTTRGDTVTMTVVTNTANTDANVAFDVNGKSTDANLPQDIANAVSLRLMRHMREDARTRPNGFKYNAYAQEGDTKTGLRAVAYQAIGMSRPTYARAGNTQYATVRNGKLTPDNDALRLEEGNNAFNLYNDAWRGVVDNFKAQRNRQR